MLGIEKPQTGRSDAMNGNVQMEQAPGLREEITKPIRKSKDMRYLLVYRMPDLEKVLGYCRKTIQNMIDNHEFPEGRRRRDGAQRTWNRRIVDYWALNGMKGIPAE